MMMSQRTTSGRTSAIRSTARRPSPTVTTSKSSSEKVSSMTFWIVMLSSASRIFLPIGASLREVSLRPVKIDRHHRYVKESRTVAARLGRGYGGLYQPDDVLRRGPGEEDLRHADLLQDLSLIH